VCRSRSHRPHTYGDDRVGRTTEITWLVGRPSPTWRHARSGRDRSCQLPRNRRWPLSAPDRHAGVQDQQSRDVTAIFGRDIPVSAITRPRQCLSSSCLSVAIPSQANRTTASRVGTRQRRSRPRRACPQDGDGRQRNPGGSVVPPTRPPPHAPSRASRWTSREAGPCARSASGAGRERRANPHLPDQVDTACLTGAPETHGVDDDVPERVPRNAVPRMHDCSRNLAEIITMEP
jgi:hypothetical protein